ncbi:MAG TPA: hypothetical protein VLQ93_08945, partial [Myxococcaceae bacterium]|nr:hypothetical protein [Myxococcaceae bacterium]
NRRGRAFFTGWDISRRYTEKELQSAEVLQLVPRAFFEPVGEMCGTEYDESGACPHCGVGFIQKTDLFLDARRIPKKKDLVISIASEILVSSRLVEAFQARGITGASFQPVRHKTGRLLEEWRQLVITSPPVDIVPPTLIGSSPFDLDERGRFRCPLGHVLGLHRLSELWLSPAGNPGTDWMRTRQHLGWHQGVLRPHPELLISPRLYRLLRELKATRFDVEVAHWNPTG